MTTILDKKYIVPAHVACTEVAGEMVLIDTSTDSVFGIDEVGLRIWQALVNGTPCSDALDAISDEYEVDRATLEGDAEEFVGNLLCKGVLQPGS